MLFNSLTFLVFFPVTTIIYFALPQRFRWAHLLACSCLFYASFIPGYLFILLAVVLIDYGSGIGIEKSTGRARDLLLLASLMANVGVLALFKYFNFVNGNLHALAQALHWNYPVRDLGWLLPIGLSFHTFQSMSYTIEVYRGNQKAERNLGIYALYVMFYPQLVAGPIERPQNLLHQFREHHAFDSDRIFSGLRLMLWGLFKKLVVADRVAPLVDSVYHNPHDYGGGWLVLATYFFAIQIYCDFSGYSDVAIGAARVLGFRLMTNFDRPYAAHSIAEFWRRWHISLSTWFRDYLYIPLGGSRVNFLRWGFNILVVFIVSGLWHGAAWTYLVWGALHGAFLVAERVAHRLFPLHSLSRYSGKGEGEGNNVGRALPAALTVWRAVPALHGSPHPNPVAGSRPTRSPLPYYGERGNARGSALWTAISIFITFNLVSLAWIFFRAPTVSQAWWIVTHLATGPWLMHPPQSAFLMGQTPFGANQIRLAIVLIVAMEIIQWLGSTKDALQKWGQTPFWVRWPVYYTAIVFILLVGDLGSRSFIYFQF